MKNIVLNSLAISSLIVASVPLSPVAAQSSDVLTETITYPRSGSTAPRSVDLLKAKPLALPKITGAASRMSLSAPPSSTKGSVQGRSIGSLPTGRGAVLGPASLGSGGSGVSSRNYGTLNHPFTTARVQRDFSNAFDTAKYPSSVAGKLFFKVNPTDSGFASCSASAIGPNLVVTAAHCVYRNSTIAANRKFYSNWYFYPALTVVGSSVTGPYGFWRPATIYIQGTYATQASCVSSGVICTNDIAVMRMNLGGVAPSASIGSRTGWYGYAWGFFGYAGNGINHFTQLGYPGNLDSANTMQRNDSYSYVSSSLLNNQIIGSNMEGGSSGGPWLMNFGIPGNNSSPNGQFPNGNVVSGVTSWGYINPTLKEQGASPFLSTNIVPLAQTACGGALQC